MRGYACGLHPETLRLFDGLGLMPALLEAGHRIDRLVVHRGERQIGRAELAAVGGAHPFALTLRQAELEELLARELVRRGLSISRHHAVTQLFPRHGCVRVSGHLEPAPGAGPDAHEGQTPIEREADFVIGADGFFSASRRALGLALRPMLPTRAFAVCEFLADLDGWEREAHIVLSRDAVSAFWPLGQNLGRWTFQIWKQLDEELSLDRLRALLEERAPWFAPNPEQLCWGSVASFEHRLLPSFGRGRIWLAGDAAHSTSPIGFQSMNRGFCEADGLATLIASALYDDDHRPDLFERFEREQQAEWERLFGLRPEATLAMWQEAELVSSLPASGADLDVLLMQLRRNTERAEAEV